MRIITRRQEQAAARRVRLLQDQLAEAKSATLEQARANGRLVRAAEAAQAELRSACAALTVSHRELLAQRDGLQQQVLRLQADLDRAVQPDKRLALTAAGTTGAEAA